MANRVRVSLTVDPKNSERLKELSDKTRIPQARLLDEAIELLSKKYKKEGK